MLLEILRFILLQLLIAVVVVTEYTLGLPLLTVTLILTISTAMTSLESSLFIMISSVLVASVFFANWLLVFSLLGVGIIALRTHLFKSRRMPLPSLLLILFFAVVISGVNQPTITFSFVIHSIISLILSIVIITKQLKLTSRQSDFSHLRISSRSV